MLTLQSTRNVERERAGGEKRRFRKCVKKIGLKILRLSAHLPGRGTREKRQGVGRRGGYYDEK
jgi:hypothetical protein